MIVFNSILVNCGIVAETMSNLLFGGQSSFVLKPRFRICGRWFEKGKRKKLNTKPMDQYQGGTGLILTKKDPTTPHRSTTQQRLTLQGNSLMQQFKKLLQKDWGEHYSRPSMASPIPSKLHPPWSSAWKDYLIPLLRCSPNWSFCNKA